MNDPAGGDRPKAKSLKPLRALWPFIRQYRAVLSAAIAALLVASAAMLAMPVALRYLIDNGFIAGDAATVNRYFGWFLAATVVFSLFASLRYYLVTWLGERVVADIRNAVYARVIRMDPAFFEVTRSGEVLSRLTTDTTLVQSISGAGLSIALRSTLSLLGGLGGQDLHEDGLAVVPPHASLKALILVLEVGQFATVEDPGELRLEEWLSISRVRTPRE